MQSAFVRIYLEGGGVLLVWQPEPPLNPGGEKVRELWNELGERVRVREGSIIATEEISAC